MKKIPFFLICSAAILAGGAGFMAAKIQRSYSLTKSIPAVEQVIGKRAPELIFRDLNNTSNALSSFGGKTIVLNFWASWCPPCVEEMAIFSSFTEKSAHNQDIIIIGIAEDNETDARQLLETKPVNYLIGFESSEVPGSSRAFGNFAQVLPFSALINPHGIISKIEVGSFDSSEEFEEWLGFRSDS